MGSGVLNTVVGFATIFLLMRLGVPALVANVAGYAVGLVLGFVVSKKLVFRTGSPASKEATRYLAAFALAFVANFAVVAAVLRLTALNSYVVQALGAGTYTVCMYLLSRHFVFRAANRPH
jgi:putative flippase GtrA